MKSTHFSPVIVLVFGIAATMLASGCSSGTDNTTAATSTAISASTITPPSKMVGFTTNRALEQGWWTWPPVKSTPDPSPTPIVTTVQISGDVLFNVDRADLTVAAGSQLDGLVQLAVQHPDATVTITGYTDSDGTEQYNLDLSKRRAHSVADWLAQHGVDISRLHVEGRGEAEPFAPNDTDQHKAANRRVVITIQSS